MGAAVGMILSALDLLVYFCTFGPLFTILKLLKPKPTVKAITNASDAPRRRTTSVKQLLKTPFPEANVYTLHDLMWHCGKIYRDRPAFGTRAFLGDGTADPEKGQRFPPKVFGETAWITVTLNSARTHPNPPEYPASMLLCHETHIFLRSACSFTEHFCSAGFLPNCAVPQPP